MATMTFDSAVLVRELRESGIPQDQAEAVVSAIAKAQESLVTKQDLVIALMPIKLGVVFIGAGVASLVAGMISLMVKAFFA
jgi:hypothetical protein